tara:strand:+ start:1089 stop:1568 length:480 start_codon:yes stop_codon:yes gene_type:complete
MTIVNKVGQTYISTTGEESSFTLTKVSTYANEEEFDKYYQRIVQLDKDKDTFTDVYVPSFSYFYSGLTLTIESEFIKGLFAGPRHQHILYDNLVQRESDWTFADYIVPNFIVEGFTEKIYCIDLQSYQKASKDKRLRKWYASRKNPNILQRHLYAIPSK